MAYSLKMDKKEACVVVYFGDGSTSEVIKSSIFDFSYSHLSDIISESHFLC